MAEPLLENCFAARAGKRRQNITFASAGEPSQMKQAFRIWLKSTPRYKLPSRLAGGAGATRIGRVINKKRKARKMKIIHIYQSAAGWIYEIWFDGRPLVVGCSKTREKAELEAAIA